MELEGPKTKIMYYFIYLFLKIACSVLGAFPQRRVCICYTIYENMSCIIWAKWYLYLLLHILSGEYSL